MQDNINHEKETEIEEERLWGLDFYFVKAQQVLAMHLMTRGLI